MAERSDRRIDRASRRIAATPERLYRAMIDRQDLVVWLSPGGMTAQVDGFEAQVGGGCRMRLTYDERDRAQSGKTTADSDVVMVRFVELVPGARIGG